MQLKREYKKKNPYLIKKGKIFAKYHLKKKENTYLFAFPPQPL